MEKRERENVKNSGGPGRPSTQQQKKREQKRTTGKQRTARETRNRDLRRREARRDTKFVVGNNGLPAWQKGRKQEGERQGERSSLMETTRRCSHRTRAPETFLVSTYTMCSTLLDPGFFDCFFHLCR
ncbi:hypothetical protein TGMAS_415830 [Toxoplasma gondii MAS]|uniref:Uncharacterized protein n=1 Tax=Toxoplasma gondii MAS TaxID=943118 RepID=A0A086Q3T7_TOXGO|nr:hypothetical protein TGMAS_415830 [Toxoplasma gondii MAS]